MTSRSWFSISNRAGETEVFLFDEIGAHGITAKAFVAALKPHAQKSIRLRVNSPGGSVFDAVAIYNALKGHPRKVTASIEGIRRARPRSSSWPPPRYAPPATRS